MTWKRVQFLAPRWENLPAFPNLEAILEETTMSSKTASSKMSPRKCANIKSKKQPDQRCSGEATIGDFCTKHHKKPTRFPLLKNYEVTLNKRHTNLIGCLQKAYRFRNNLRRYRKQGPATTFTNIAENSTEICSFDPVTSIPMMFRFSFADSNKHIFIFDIRTLYQLLETTGYTVTNPYTREIIPKNIVDKLINRVNQLRNKKYCLLFEQEGNLSSEQLLHQRVVDICLKYDFLGFYTSPKWFEILSLRDLKDIYISLYSMFISHPIADSETLNQIYPKRNEDLFELRISGINNRKDKMTMQYAVLDIFEKLVTTAKKKEDRCLGATYSLKAWA